MSLTMPAANTEKQVRTNAIWGDDWAATAAQWMLDPGIAFLNHGSFGAAPRPVLEAQARWRDQMEARPVEFLDRRLPGLLDEALSAVGALLGSSTDRLAFVPNATTAINSVVKSLNFEPGDELVIAEHGYGAVIRTLERVASRWGARVVRVPFELPVESGDQIVEAWKHAMTDRTRFVVVDHITSPSAIVCPVKEIVAALAREDRIIMVDAAHGPGMVPIDLSTLGADCWTGNLHKWVCAPKGAAAIWIREGLEETIEPAVTSHDRGGFAQAQFKWTGTADPTAYLSVPRAIEFLGSLGWDRLRTHNHDLVRYGRQVVADVCGTGPIVPDDSDLFGSMAVVELPDSLGIRTAGDEAALNARLHDEFGVEVPVMARWGKGYVRLSAQVYNAPTDYERLACALRELSQ